MVVWVKGKKVKGKREKMSPSVCLSPFTFYLSPFTREPEASNA